MTTIILIIHILIAIGLIAMVLLQRSEGGALGIGGGGGGSFMSGRGAANALTRTTSILAAGFFTTSIVLTLLARGGDENDAILEGLENSLQQETSAPAVPDGSELDLSPTVPGATDAADTAPTQIDDAGGEQPEDEPAETDPPQL